MSAISADASAGAFSLAEETRASAPARVFATAAPSPAATSVRRRCTSRRTRPGEEAAFPPRPAPRGRARGPPPTGAAAPLGESRTPRDETDVDERSDERARTPGARGRGAPPPGLAAALPPRARGLGDAARLPYGELAPLAMPRALFRNRASSLARFSAT